MSIPPETAARLSQLDIETIGAESKAAAQAWLDAETVKENPNQALIDALTAFINQ